MRRYELITVSAWSDKVRLRDTMQWLLSGPAEEGGGGGRVDVRSGIPIIPQNCKSCDTKYLKLPYAFNSCLRHSYSSAISI